MSHYGQTTSIDSLAAQGTDPAQVVTLDTGLEVPVYLLQRDQQRKDNQAAIEEHLENVPEPYFYNVAKYAMLSPGKAALASLLFGILVGKYF